MPRQSASLPWSSARRVSVATVDEVIDERAWEWLRRHDERSYSYVDATSFEIMRRDASRRHAFDGDFVRPAIEVALSGGPSAR